MARPRHHLLAASALTLAVTLLSSTTVGAASPDQQQLQRAREQIEAVERELEAAEDDADDAEAELADADARLAELEAIVNDVAATLDRQRGAVALAAQRLTEVQDEAAAVRTAFERRTAALFKQGAIRDFDLLLSSSGAEEALERTSYLRALTRGDAATVESLAAAEVAVDVERQRLAAEEDRLGAMLAEQQQLHEQVQRIRDSRALAAADARARVEELSDEHAQLETASEELEALARASSSTPAATRGGSAGGAGYAWPYCGPVTSEYGRRWGRMHNGIDLGGGTGTPIGASNAGTVIFAGWNDGGYGNLVLIDHGDGVVTAYAHQSRIATSTGSVVSRGQTIGYVGSTGRVTGPHLHQEFRVSGSPVNPRQYLRGSPC